MKKQLSLDTQKSRRDRSQHGGSIRNPQKYKRPLGFRSRNHFVLRSTKAKGEWSFRRFKFEIQFILKKFARKHHVGVIAHANVGNHLHFELEISNRQQYQKFIRAISSAIMMQVTGYSRWEKAPDGFHFWDARPFSRVLSSWREVLVLERYIHLNVWQGFGAKRAEARWLANLGWKLHQIHGGSS